MMKWGVVFFVAGVAAVVAGQVLFCLHQPYPPPARFAADPMLPVSLSLFLGGMLFALIGLLRLPLPSLGVGESTPGTGRTSLSHKVAFLVVALLAFAVRGYQITEMPPPLFDDEANTALDAMKFLDGRFPTVITTGWGDVPGVYSAMNSVALALFGPTVLGARMTGLVCSTLTVFAMYFVGRTMMGPSAGLLVMLALALQRWHITMSRWGASEIVLPLFAALAFAFTARGFDLVVGAETADPWVPRNPGGSKHRQESPLSTDGSGTAERALGAWRNVPWLSILWGGALLGACMYVYLASRLVALGMFLFLVYFLLYAIGASRRQGRFSAGMLVRPVAAVLMFGVTYLAVFYPMATYYLQHLGVFTNRYKNISLPAQMGIGTGTIDWSPLWENLSAYSLMLNYASNDVSRHGIPFEPLLNPLSGSLFCLGGVFLVRHWWRPANVFCLLWVALPLLGGAITVSETPSPYRTIVAASGVAVVMVIPIYFLILEVARRGAWRRGSRLRGGVLVGAIALLLLSGGWNLYAYWETLRNVPALAMHYNYSEYVVARYVQDVPELAPVYLYPHHYTFSSVKLLNWKRPNVRLFAPSEHIPLLEPSETDVHVIVPFPYRDVLPLIRAFHPGIEVKEHPVAEMPGFGHLEVILPAHELEASRGLWVHTGAGDRRIARDLAAPSRSPERLEEVMWEGVLDVPTAGAYQFAVRSTEPLGDRSSLNVLGRPVAGPGVTLNLLKGRAELQVTLRSMQPSEELRLEWRRPGQEWKLVPLDRLYALPAVGSFGLHAAYYRGTDLAGEPFAERNDLTLAANDSIPSPHSVRWTGLLDIDQAGVYSFHVRADDGVRLYLDGELLIDEWEAGGTVTDTVKVKLQPGPHPIELAYFDQGGGRILQFTWTRPDGRRGMIPFEFFSLPRQEIEAVPFRQDGSERSAAPGTASVGQKEVLTAALTPTLPRARGSSPGAILADSCSRYRRVAGRLADGAVGAYGADCSAAPS